MDFRIPVGNWINSVLDWAQNNMGAFFGGMRSTFKGMYDGMEWLFASPPTLAIIAVLAVAGLFARGWKFAVGLIVGLLFIVGVDQWDNAVSTLALVIVAAFIAIALSIPLGIWAARNDTVSKVLKPAMDFLQTMPAFVYLMPALALLRVGIAPGIFATILFAMAPGVRLTELGIRGVDKEVVEAGQAFGASPRRILRQIQLPLAMPSIMAGINQIIMLSLSMVVIAGLVGAGGLGGDVVRSLSSLDYPLGFEAGLSVVVLAIILDRFTGAFGQRMGLYSALRTRHATRKTAEELARAEAQLESVGGRRAVGTATH
ncbi:MAG: ABC transporter permease [Demequina sp.]